MVAMMAGGWYNWAWLKDCLFALKGVSKMKLDKKKKLAAKVFGVGKQRIRFVERCRCRKIHTK